MFSCGGEAMPASKRRGQSGGRSEDGVYHVLLGGGYRVLEQERYFPFGKMLRLVLAQACRFLSLAGEPRSVEDAVPVLGDYAVVLKLVRG